MYPKAFVVPSEFVDSIRPQPKEPQAECDPVTCAKAKDYMDRLDYLEHEAARPALIDEKALPDEERLANAIIKPLARMANGVYGQEARDGLDALRALLAHEAPKEQA